VEKYLTLLSIVRERPIKLATKSKKIRKRRRTKGGVKLRRDLENILLNAPKKYLPTEIEDPNLDDKTKRQLVQKVKNRIASQKTRNQRRNYISELEEVKIHLTKANEELNERNRLLEERLKQLENEKNDLVIENQELKKKQIISNIEPVDNFITYEASPVLSRSSSKSHNNYKFFLGIFMVLAAFSEVKIKSLHISIVQQERREEENLFVSKGDYVVHISHADEERVYMCINDPGLGEEGSMAEEEKELEIVEDDQDRGIVSMVMRLFLFVFFCKKKKENHKKEKRNKALQLRLGKNKSYRSLYLKKVAKHNRFLVT